MLRHSAAVDAGMARSPRAAVVPADGFVTTTAPHAAASSARRENIVGESVTVLTLNSTV